MKIKLITVDETEASEFIFPIPDTAALEHYNLPPCTNDSDELSGIVDSNRDIYDNQVDDLSDNEPPLQSQMKTT